MRKEKGGKRGKKKIEERQGGDLDERTEERTEERTDEGTEETEERIQEKG